MHPVTDADSELRRFRRPAHAAIRLEAGSSAALHTCSFRDNTADPGAAPASENSPSAPGGPDLGLLSSPPSSAWLQGCTFVGSQSNTAGDIVVEASACPVFSDQRDRPTVWDAQAQVTMTPQWLEFGGGGVTWGPPADQEPFLNEADPWIVDARQVRLHNTDAYTPRMRHHPRAVEPPDAAGSSVSNCR